MIFWKQNIFYVTLLLKIDVLYIYYLCSPHKPEFEDIIMPTTLDHFISSIVTHVVAFVGLEQIIGRHLVAAN